MKNTGLFFASLLFSLLMAELILRTFDVLPYHQSHGFILNEPQLLDADAELGWMPRPGRYVWKEPMPGHPNLIFTIGEDRLRVTGGGVGGTRPEIALIGACPTSRHWLGNSNKG